MNQTVDIQSIIEQITALDIEEDKNKKKRRELVAALGAAKEGSFPLLGNVLQAGDRVRITNKVKIPVSANKFWTKPKERLAFVERIEEDRVFVKTDNGTHTWRLRKHLKPV